VAEEAAFAFAPVAIAPAVLVLNQSAPGQPEGLTAQQEARERGQVVRRRGERAVGGSGLDPGRRDERVVRRGRAVVM
jgi:hypothetical protein